MVARGDVVVSALVDFHERVSREMSYELFTLWLLQRVLINGYSISGYCLACHEVVGNWFPEYQHVEHRSDVVQYDGGYIISSEGSYRIGLDEISG